eukprot:4595240-Ditylum_brightwellii.AAC.1
MEGTVTANCPNIVILDEEEKKALIIGVIVSMDINMIKAAAVHTPDCGRCPRYNLSELGTPAHMSVTKS